MNRKFKWLTAASCAIAALSVCTACHDDDINSASGTAANMYNYNVTVETVANGTRSLSEGPDNALHSTWEATDKIIAYNLSDGDDSKAGQFSLLGNVTVGKNGKFDGQISTVKPIKTTDELCFLYPSPSELEESNSTIQSVKKVTDKEDGEEVTYYAPQETIKRFVELNLTTQDGTVETIGKKFDFQWGKVNPTSVDGNTVKANMGIMKRQIAIWGLQFTDKSGNTLKDIDAVYICGVKSLDVFDLGTGKFMDDVNSGENDIVLLKPGERENQSSPLRITNTLMRPYCQAHTRSVLIAVYIGNKCYAREYTDITLNADKVYRSNVKDMEEVVGNPYVEVQGVKWATGNFIHYGQDGSGTDYWGIAPTQWWISQYDMVDPNSGLRTTSQFTKEDIEADPNDLDQFRFGDIAKVLSLNANDSKQRSLDLCKKFYATSIAAENNTVERNKAKYGDVVWYYTMNDNQKYRMPTYDDLSTLYDVANVIPGYCIAPTGKRIYGAFFYTNVSGDKNKRKRNFPTGRNTLYKYNDVTALVRANRGLFLPIAGRRSGRRKHVWFPKSERWKISLCTIHEFDGKIIIVIPRPLLRPQTVELVRKRNHTSQEHSSSMG